MIQPKKLISIGLLIGLFIILGIYLFPDEESNLSNLGAGSPAAPIHPRPEEKSSTLEQEKNPTATASTKEIRQPSIKNAGSTEEPYVFYDEAILKMLGIDKHELLKERDKYKNTVIHVEWMDRVRDILKNIDPEKLAAIEKNQTMHLYLKDKLNEAYLSGKLDHETFIDAVADLMKFHQKTYESMLTKTEYEALFEVPPEAADQYIDKLFEDIPEYSFISNPSMSNDEVVKQVQGRTMEDVNANFKKMILDKEQIGKKIGDGSMSLEQAQAAMLKSQQAFIEHCKKTLTENEINTIFGSLANLESGMQATPPTAVDGDSDKMELGFEIENPATSVQMVKEKLDQSRIDDIKFFYQQRESEREALIKKLDAGEIQSEAVESISKEMDTAFQENCREVLTDETFKMIFDVPAENETGEITSETNSDVSAGQEKASEPDAKNEGK